VTSSTAPGRRRTYSTTRTRAAVPYPRCWWPASMCSRQR